MKKIIIFFLTLPILISCSKIKIENGSTIQEVETKVNADEAKYLAEMQGIFSEYNLVLHYTYSIRATNYYYFIGQENSFEYSYYNGEIKKRLSEKGWILIDANEYGELYCKNKQEIGVTFPTDNKDLGGKKVGYFTFQSYKRVFVTLRYEFYVNNLICEKVEKR